MFLLGQSKDPTLLPTHLPGLLCVHQRAYALICRTSSPAPMQHWPQCSFNRLQLADCGPFDGNFGHGNPIELCLLRARSKPAVCGLCPRDASRWQTCFPMLLCMSSSRRTAAWKAEEAEIAVAIWIRACRHPPNGRSSQPRLSAFRNSPCPCVA